MPLDVRAAVRVAPSGRSLLVAALLAVLGTATPALAWLPSGGDAERSAAERSAVERSAVERSAAVGLLPPALTVRTTETALLLQLADPAGQPAGVTYTVTSGQDVSGASPLICRGPAPRSCLHLIEPGTRSVPLTVISSLGTRRTTTRYTVQATA